MKKFYLSVINILFCGLSVLAQEPAIKLNWLNTAPIYLNGGDFSARGVTTLSDGSVVAVGYFQHTVDLDPGPDTFNISTTSHYGFFVAKYTKQGKLSFGYGFGGGTSQNFESANAVTTDADDNIYVTGSFRGTIDFDPDSGKAILSAGDNVSGNFIACYTKNGHLKFAKDITNTKGRDGFVASNSIALDNHRNIYVTGTFQGTSVDFDPGPDSTNFSSIATDMFFAKYDSAGNYVFAKVLGGNANDFANKITLDSKNNILICGGFASGNVDFDPGLPKHSLKRKSVQDLFFAKYDYAGNYIFAKNVGNTKTNFSHSIATGKDDGFVITGSFYGTSVDFDISNPGTHLLNSNGSNDAFVAKYDSYGNCVFAFNIGNGGTYDGGVDIGIDDSDNILCTGNFTGNTVDFDPGDGVFRIKALGNNNFYIAKYTYNGNFLSVVGLSGGRYLNDFEINCLHITQSGKILLSGYYTDSFDADAGPDSTVLTTPAPTMYVAKYDSDENFIGVISGNNYFNYSAISELTSTAIDKDGNIYTCGNFTGRYDFDPGPGKYILASSINEYGSADENGYFAKYNRYGNLIFAKAITGDYNIANDIAIDENGNIYLAGNASGFTDFDPDSNTYYLNNADTSYPYSYYGYFFAKYDTNGNIVFAKGNGNSLSFRLNTTSLALDNSNNICIAGTLDYSIDFDPGPGEHILNGGQASLGNMFVAKYSTEGNYIFAYCIIAGDSYGIISDLKINRRNNIIITGTFHGTNIDFDGGPNKFLLSSDPGNSDNQSGFIAVYKNSGAIISAISINGQGYYNTFTSLTIDYNNNIYITGNSKAGADFDPGSGLSVLPKEGIFFASYTNNLTLRFLKGILNYTPSYVGNNNLQSLCLDRYNNLYVAGQFGSLDIDCDPSNDTALLLNTHYAKGTDLFIAKYDSLGNYIYSYKFTGDSAIGTNKSAAILVDSRGIITYTGSFYTKINFSTGNKEMYAEPTTMSINLFITQYRPAFVQAEFNSKAAKLISGRYIKVYPNPVNDKLTIQLNSIEQNNSTAIIYLYDAQGKWLQTSRVNFINHYLNTTIGLPKNLSAGIYFIKVEIEGETYYSDALIK